MPIRAKYEYEGRLACGRQCIQPRGAAVVTDAILPIALSTLPLETGKSPEIAAGRSRMRPIFAYALYMQDSARTRRA